MADVKIRDLDDQLVDFFRRRAAHKGVSLEEELRQTLAEERRRDREEMLAEIDTHLAEMERRYGVLPDSAPGIRAERDGEPDV